MSAKIIERCPNGHFELEATGPTLEYIKEEVLEDKEKENYCPICEADVEREEHESEGE